MMEDYIIQLLKEKVIPAVGCTEPIAVALAATKAKELLDILPEKIEIKLSKNVLKNGMNVGIPGTDQTGLTIAVGLGILFGKSEDTLELLKNVSDEMVEQANNYIKNTPITFSIADTDEKLYIEAICIHGSSHAKAVIAHTHTNFILLEKNNTIIYSSDNNHRNNCVNYSNNNINKDICDVLTLKKIYDFITICDIDNIKFLVESAVVNKKAAEIGIAKEYGLCVGQTIKNNIKENIYKDSILSYALLLTTAAIDARMGGANITIYSNSGSGDQGITVTLPVVAFYEKYYNKNIYELESSDYLFIRALALSHAVAIYIKQKLGVLSPFCGITTASIGAACGITYLMNGKYEHICNAIKNCAANIIGMICDGAKNGCAVKAASGVFNAFTAATLAINHHCHNNQGGIVNNCVETTIENLTDIGKKGMMNMDDIILDMLLQK